MQPLSLPTGYHQLAGDGKLEMLSLSRSPKFSLQVDPTASCWSVLFGGCWWPFSGVVGPKANLRFEGIEDLRAGLPRENSVSKNMQDSFLVGSYFLL